MVDLSLTFSLWFSAKSFTVHYRSKNSAVRMYVWKILDQFSGSIVRHIDIVPDSAVYWMTTLPHFFSVLPYNPPSLRYCQLLHSKCYPIGCKEDLLHAQNTPLHESRHFEHPRVLFIFASGAYFNHLFAYYYNSLLYREMKYPVPSWSSDISLFTRVNMMAVVRMMYIMVGLITVTKSSLKG